MPTLTLPLFPLSQPLFPDSLMQLRIFEVRYLHMIKHCQKENRPFGVVALRHGGEVQKPGADESIHATGCLAHLDEVVQVQQGLLFIQYRGGQRFHIEANERGAYGLWHGQVRLLEPDLATDLPPDLQPLADKLGALIANAQRQGAEGQLPITRPYRLDECGWVANQWAMLLALNGAEKTKLLAEDDPLTRLTMVKLLLA